MVRYLFLFLWLIPCLIIASGRRASGDRVLLTPIGSVQGEVADDMQEPKRHRSPMQGQTVQVRGVVHQLLQWETMKGEPRYGILVQNAAKDADENPRTSDGLFVYCGRTPHLPQGAQSYQVRIGDVVTLSGVVKERYGQTELAEARVLSLGRPVDVDQAIRAVPLKLHPDSVQTLRELERHEGMRVQLVVGAACLGGRHIGTRNGDAQLMVTSAENPVLSRREPSHRRVFRDPHPLDDVKDRLHDNGNGNRLAVGSLGLKASLQDRNAMVPAVHTGMVLKKALVGGIQFSWGEYVFQPTTMPAFHKAPSPADWRIKVASPAAAVTISSFNLENLYDFRDDPTDDCDFHTDQGCPGSRFPLNYVPASDDVYQARLEMLARQITEDMGAPSLIMVQELEDQDIATLRNGQMVYGEADGALDVLQELSLAVRRVGGPLYHTAADRDGADTRGIVCGVLFDPAVFALVKPNVSDPVLGRTPGIPLDWEWSEMCNEVQNPKAFNAEYLGEADGTRNLTTIFSRAMQVAKFAWVQQPDRNPLWVLNNHFSSRPNAKVQRRTLQARMNAGVVEAILAGNPDADIVVGGDLNVFPRPDDPFETPSDQLAPLYNVGLWNSYDWVVSKSPDVAYSYVYQGVAGTLDHLFLSPGLREGFVGATFLHLNADWSDPAGAHPDRRASDHDPLVLWFEGAD